MSSGSKEQIPGEGRTFHTLKLEQRIQNAVTQQKHSNPQFLSNSLSFPTSSRTGLECLCNPFRLPS